MFIKRWVYKKLWYIYQAKWFSAAREQTADKHINTQKCQKHAEWKFYTETYELYIYTFSKFKEWKIIPQWKRADRLKVLTAEANRSFGEMIYIFCIMILVVVTCIYLSKLIGCKLKICVFYCTVCVCVCVCVLSCLIMSDSLWSYRL